MGRRLAKHLARDGGSESLVQFHPSYSYEDFVEGYRPTVDDDKAGFRLRPGPLLQAAELARERPGAHHVLVIDELNRLAAVRAAMQTRDDALDNGANS